MAYHGEVRCDGPTHTHIHTISLSLSRSRQTGAAGLTESGPLACCATTGPRIWCAALRKVSGWSSLATAAGSISGSGCSAETGIAQPIESLKQGVGETAQSDGAHAGVAGR